jgi:hypothetical protein
MLEGKWTDKTYVRSATRHSSTRSGEKDQGPSRGLRAQALALLNLPKQEHLSITDNLTTDLLNEYLIKGYLVPPESKTIPPLQLRRTLDQYFYTHLKSTSQRDSDQVVSDIPSEPTNQKFSWSISYGYGYSMMVIPSLRSPTTLIANIYPQKQS